MLSLGWSQCDGSEVELWGECYSIEETTYLDLSWNQLTGSISPEIGNLTNLIDLNLSYNELTGEIPSEIGDMTNLTDLFLLENQLSGEIPPEISYLTNLTNLDLGGNQLIGEIPSEIGDLINLMILDLGGNQLTGEIPSEIGNLTNLTELELGGNPLTGEIPSEIGNLNNLTFLHIEYNQLTGEMPPEIGNLTNLIWLNLVHNQLSGEIPSSICSLDMNWGNPNNFNIYDNQLCPPYPVCVEEYVGYQDTSECVDCSDIIGDLNYDSIVDIFDIITMVDCMLDITCDECSDLDGDGNTDVLDIIVLVDIILSGTDMSTVTDIDGNVYETIQIGNQLWMSENLKVTHYQNGDEIPYSYNDPQYGAYAEYNNDASNVAVYGRLYNWFSVNDERGLCPVDWHVPSDDELKELEMYLGLSESEANSEGLRGTDEGGKLKEEGTEHWNSPNTGATNETGFTALPGGTRRYDTYTNQEVWCCLNRYGFFWSSSEVYTVNAWYRVLSFDYSESNRYHLNKGNGFSIRCVGD